MPTIAQNATFNFAAPDKRGQYRLPNESVGGKTVGVL